MQIKQTKDFQKAFKNLQQDIKKFYQIQENRFIVNWRDSRLHIKKVKNLDHAFSFRITRRYRVFFYFQDPETAIFFDIDHRKDIYRNL
ncbi:hypothetical protein KAJ61_03540 [Candidatus Parcubacteria bacterium]|nr:hypothetical protein [Candidatus Parcubacteria bacterium]